jgi:hypothetical protein
LVVVQITSAKAPPLEKWVNVAREIVS